MGWDHWPDQVGQFTAGLISFPTTSVFGDLIHVRGKAEVLTAGACTAGQPVPVRRSPRSQPLVLQTRNSSSAAWATVDTNIWPDATGAFQASFIAIGARQYRVLAPSVSNDALAGTDTGSAFEGATPTANFTTKYKLNSAKVVSTTSPTGVKQAVASIRLGPANNVRTTLQKWDGKAWVSVKWVYVGNGAGQFTFPSPPRGSYACRFVVPSSTFNGLVIGGITTGTMALTVR
ncbi:hypothetical protein F1D05_24855 [Kribbella qitaiheensis]|uniref:Uncharacterized protein n=1 Tax=Kribbella qitaiheensis TaxID=1544730 RepID=A0A7G6X2T4_9ACTN|nr:hypothetical protein [Kribbella qitaiheensis]QNE20549.1 hypothetical protein F1D05_24855 [Kribbella qitaiheensis]